MLLLTVLGASSLLPPRVVRTLESSAVTRFALRTPMMTLMTEMQAQMERLQRELDIAKEALENLNPTQNEVTPATGLDTATESGVTGSGVAAESAQAVPDIESAADVVARAQAMMEQAMMAAQAITKKATVAVDSAAQLIEAHPAAAQDVEVPAAVAVESAADVVARTQAMMKAFEAAQAAAGTASSANDMDVGSEQRIPVIESAAEVVARAQAMEQEMAEPATEVELAASQQAAVAAAVGALPSARFPALAVVQAQLQALQSGTPQRCFEFTSPSARRQCSNAELFGQMILGTPAYKPLVCGSRYEITSALSTTPRNWQCRVRVDGRDYLWKLSRQQEELLDIGTVVQHATAGYVGVIVGYDDVCRRTEEWCQLMGVDALPRGRTQPFYHVMVDSGARADGQPADLEEMQATYAAQDLIRPRPPLAPVDHSWQAPLTLPGQLFTGAIDDAAGTWVPTPFLRAVYPRGLDGCWLIDSVAPDEPPEVATP